MKKILVFVICAAFFTVSISKSPIDTLSNAPADNIAEKEILLDPVWPAPTGENNSLA
ncbi:hypothetical protein LIS77_14160 [Cytobacillus firmus]|uniref:hypothetical protein n=1 Tax=Cytobacillus firmus TaxID=1399 RepID=UPI002079D781|nr:hypothetical protein [Cytobacillus firmus]USK37083.1 hypothetical protein LIS77_14160 [Cytobacillus firmus]